MGHHVMIVDDDPTWVRLCRLILEREGHQVVGVFSGKECLDHLRRHPVDLILLDVLLNDIDGWELLDRIQKDERWRRIPVIVVTGLSRWQAENQAHSHALAGYIIKPFQVAKFLEQVRYAFSNSGHHEEARKEIVLPLPRPAIQSVLH